MGWYTNSVFGINWSVTPKCVIITATHSTFIGSLWCSLRYKHNCSPFSVPTWGESHVHLHLILLISVFTIVVSLTHCFRTGCISLYLTKMYRCLLRLRYIWDARSHQNIMFFDSVKFLFLSSFDRRRKILIDKTDPILSNHFSSRRWLVLWK